MGAVSAAGDMPGAESTAALLDAFDNLSANNRNIALDALLRNSDRVAALLDRIESNRLPRTALGEAHAKRLKSHADESLRKRAAQLLP
jgi:hypothetical protein